MSKIHLLHLDLGDEDNSVHFYREEDGYRAVHYTYCQGERYFHQEFFFPNDNLPEGLIVVLIEADGKTRPVKSLEYKHQSLLWNLIDDDSPYAIC